MYRLGIDLGGTNTVAGVVGEDYQIIGSASAKTLAHRNSEEIAATMVDVAFEAVKKAGIGMESIACVGVGSPGGVNPDTGIVESAGNLNFNHFPLAEILSKLILKKVFIENDANAAAYGEYIAGAGKGTKDFVAITLGTGIGGGIIINGMMFSGQNYLAGEIGHMVIKSGGQRCSCGRKGCFEAYCSATALVRQTKHAMQKNRGSIMWELSQGGRCVTGRTAFDAMRAGDEAAQRVVEKYISYLGDGILTVNSVFQPDVICIGGGISNEKDALIIPLKEYISRADSKNDMSDRTRICTAHLGNNAGIVGAAFLDRLQRINYSIH